MLQPLASLISVPAVVHADFVHRKDDLEGVDHGRGVVQLLLLVALNEDTHQTVHVLVSLIVLLLVA